MLKNVAIEVQHFKTSFVMDIEYKTKEGLQIELQKLLQENNSLTALKEQRASELNLAKKELVFQKREKVKRADELIMANKELAFQNKEKEKRAAELILANKELVFQNKEKEKRAAELILANKELVFQNREKEKRADELVIANKELAFQNEEKEKRAAELIAANKELAHQNKLKEKIAVDHVITNKKLQQLIQLNKDKDKFFSIITHDLKNPFNSIIGFSELLIEQIEEKDYEKIEEYAKIILQSSNNAMELLTNLMEWAQSQSGRMDFNPKCFDIIPLIDEVRHLLNDIAEQKSILIVNTLPASIQVTADKEMIGTVLRNLISNAIKFTQPEGKITIAAVEKQNQLTVSVSDTGVGISKERIDKIFNITDGYSTPGTQNEKGTGLGLILCKEFITKNKGEIWAESKTGMGTTFSFSLPLSIDNKQNSDLSKNKMNKKQKKQRKLQPSVSLTNQSLAGKERENPQKEPVIPFPDISTFPDLPDEKPDPTHPKHGINEHDINDPTRTDEFPPIFN